MSADGSGPVSADGAPPAPADGRIYHLTSRSAWDAAQPGGTYRTSTHGMTLEEVGFIHASTAEQVPWVADLVYANVDEELVLLVMDVDTLERAGLPVVFEDPGVGRDFPHIYGELPCRLVVEVRPAHFDEHGVFRFEA